jgi:hypothetical protein
MLARGAKAAVEGPEGYSEEFLADRIATASFYAETILSTVPGLIGAASAGADDIYEIDSARF